MIPAQRFMAAAALVFALCAGTSCDRKPAGGEIRSPDPAVEILIREGTAAFKESRNTDALSAYQKALALTNKDDDPMGWAFLATKTALVHEALASWKEAEILLTEALRLSEQHRGPEAWQTANFLSELARILKKMNRPAEAEPLIRRALAIEEASSGKDHLNVAIQIDNLTQVLKATNRLHEAEPLLRRSLAIFETTYGKDSLSVAANLEYLVQLLRDTNRTAEADPLQSRWLEITIPNYVAQDPRHPSLEKMTSEFRALRIKMGDTEAEAQEKIDKLLKPTGKK